MPIGCDATTILLPRTASSIDCHYPNAQPRLCILQEPPRPSSDLHIASTEGRCPNQRQQGRALMTDRPHVFHHIRATWMRESGRKPRGVAQQQPQRLISEWNHFSVFFGQTVWPVSAAAGLICSSLLHGLIIEAPPSPGLQKTHHSFFWFTISVHQLWELLQKATESHTTTLQAPAAPLHSCRR